MSVEIEATSTAVLPTRPTAADDQPRPTFEEENGGEFVVNQRTLKVACAIGLVEFKESEATCQQDVSMVYIIHPAFKEDAGNPFSALKEGKEDEEKSSWWKPKLEFRGTLDEKLNLRYEFHDESTNTLYVKENWMLKERMSSTLTLRRFPFDREIIPFEVEFSNCSEAKVEVSRLLQSDPVIDSCPESVKSPLQVGNMFGLEGGQYAGAAYVELANFELEKCRTTQQEEYVYSVLMYIRRRPAYYFFNVFLIMFLIVGCSFATYVISPSDSGTRMNFDITLLLTAVAYKFALASKLPEIPYLTYLDIYILLCLFILTSSVLFHYIIGILAKKGNDSEEALNFYYHLVGVSLWCFLHICGIIAYLTGKLYLPIEKLIAFDIADEGALMSAVQFDDDDQ
jgi:hypothetical protein